MRFGADSISRLIEETHRRTFQPGNVGLMAHRGGGIVLGKRGTALHPAPRVAAARDPKPFDITIEYDDGSDTYFATLRPGTINNLLVNNYLDGVSVPASGTVYLVVNVTASSGEITSATLSAEMTQPSAITPYAGQPPIAFGLLIGVVTDAVATKVWSDGNVSAVPQEAFRLQKASPVAGQLPYDCYYTWKLSLV